MLADTASRTALGAALHRAAHQLADDPPVLRDPLALKLVGAAPGDPLSPELLLRTSAEAAPLRAFVAVRSRRAEDRFAEAFARGVHQVLVLGAGLDTFAYRCTLPGVAFFEVDHPTTQAWKRARLERACVPVPARVTYAPVDLEQEALGSALDRAGLDRVAPTFVVWLGVTPYLTPEAVRATLRFVARGLGRGSEIVFDFATPAGDDPCAQAARAAFAARVEAVGEPLRSTFEPAALVSELRGLGFSRVQVEDAGALNALHFDGRADGLRLRAGQLAWAARAF